MGVLENLKLKWFLYGFFSSCEGWNGECPFAITNTKDYVNRTVELLEDIKNMLENKDKDIIELIKNFKNLMKEDSTNVETTYEIVHKICKLIEEVM